MPVNSDNFLRWNGVTKPAPFVLNSDPISGGTLYANEEVDYCFPLGLVFSSIGIDFTSINVVGIFDYSGGSDGAAIILSSPVEWDSDTQQFSFFRPIDISITSYDIQFYFADLMGNQSALCRCIIGVSSISTTWVPYPISTVCVLDAFGNNTGYKSWGQLVLQNMGTMTDIVPLTLKDNTEGDPDYYAPVQDFVTCPAPGAGSGITAPLYISNFTKNTGDPNNWIEITSIYLHSSNMGPGATPIAMNFPCTIFPGQTARFVIPATSLGYVYDGFTIQYIVTGNMATAPILRHWKQNNNGNVTGFGGGGVGTVNVDNSGAITDPGLPFNISNPLGITIFAQ